MAYPAAWELGAATIDGAQYRIRPIRPDDAQRDRDFVAGLSAESRYKRMMGTVRELAPAVLERFVNVDYKRDMAFVALVGEGASEQIIGVARYAADPGGPDCEFAVAVGDAWQGRGVGAQLTKTLMDYARLQGIRRLHGDILVGNEQMLELAHWLGMRTRRLPGDATVLEAVSELGQDMSSMG